MKKTLVRICSIAAIGLALTACGGHHDGDKDSQTTTDSTVTTTTVVKTTEEHREHEKPRNEERERKDTVKTEAGLPVIKDTAALQEKPKDESTVGGSAKHHVKPGGIQGNKVN